MGLNDGYQCAKQQRKASGIFPTSGSPTFDTQKKAECGESVSPQRSIRTGGVTSCICT